MAAAMNQTMQTCQHLAIMTQTQMMDEDKVDPFPAKTTAELEDMVKACRRTKEILARESLIYSKNADFTKYSDSELLAMSAFVRESSRMLSIILAGGPQHFWNGQDSSTLQELKKMFNYIDGKVKEFLLLDQLMETLEFKIRYGRNVSQGKVAVLSGHPDLSCFTAYEATKGTTSQETMERLAEICEKFAVQCRSVAKTRVHKMEDRAKKIEVKEKLLVEIDSVVPALRQHVLRIGMHKCQLQDGGGQQPPKTASTPANKITSLFSFKAVQEAHRNVEDCRERLMQEQLFRRAKVERRLEKEEERERLAESTRPNQLNDMPAYRDVLDVTRSPKGKLSRMGTAQSLNSSGKDRTSRSPSPAEPGATRRTRVAKESPRAEPGPAPLESPRAEPGSPKRSPKANAGPKKREESPKSREQKGAKSPKGGGRGSPKGSPNKVSILVDSGSPPTSPKKSGSPKARSKQR